MKSRKPQTGFSLIELLVVVVIILILAAVVIPNLLRSKIAANEASTVGTLRTVNAACANYSSTWGSGFPASLSYLGPGRPATATAADLVDKLVAGGAKAGYNLTYVSGAPSRGKIATYTVNANPIALNKTGVRYFFTDQTNVIRQNFGSPANNTSSPLK